MRYGWEIPQGRYGIVSITKQQRRLKNHSGGTSLIQRLYKKLDDVSAFIADQERERKGVTGDSNLPCLLKPLLKPAPVTNVKRIVGGALFFFSCPHYTAFIFSLKIVLILPVLSLHLCGNTAPSPFSWTFLYKAESINDITNSSNTSAPLLHPSIFIFITLNVPFVN